MLRFTDRKEIGSVKMNTTKIEIAKLIVNKIAATFDIPELRNAEVSEKQHGGFVAGAEFEPMGQASLMISDASIEVTVDWDRNGEKGRIWVNAAVRYDHHSGGSNGIDRRFIAVFNDYRKSVSIVCHHAFANIQ